MVAQRCDISECPANPLTLHVKATIAGKSTQITAQLTTSAQVTGLKLVNHLPGEVVLVLMTDDAWHILNCDIDIGPLGSGIQNYRYN